MRPWRLLDEPEIPILTPSRLTLLALLLGDTLLEYCCEHAANQGFEFRLARLVLSEGRDHRFQRGCVTAR